MRCFNGLQFKIEQPGKATLQGDYKHIGKDMKKWVRQRGGGNTPTPCTENGKCRGPTAGAFEDHTGSPI